MPLWSEWCSFSFVIRLPEVWSNWCSHWSQLCVCVYVCVYVFVYTNADFSDFRDLVPALLQIEARVWPVFILRPLGGLHWREIYIYIYIKQGKISRMSVCVFYCDVMYGRWMRDKGERTTNPMPALSYILVMKYMKLYFSYFTFY